jgi:ABC-type cobalamin/Fe3+-siderophores transport system ATPase subunit
MYVKSNNNSIYVFKNWLNEIINRNQLNEQKVLKNNMNTIKDSKMVAILGAPASGKSTLATSIHHGLKISKRKNVYTGYIKHEANVW